MKALIARIDIEIRHINAHQAIRATPSSAYSMQKQVFTCVDQANLALPRQYRQSVLEDESVGSFRAIVGIRR